MRMTRHGRAADAQRLCRSSTPAARRIQLDPNAGPPRIARDGTITQNNRQIGAIGLFKIDDKATPEALRELRRHSGPAGNAALDFTKVGMQQGFVERANVNPVMEMTKLIMVHARLRGDRRRPSRNSDASQQEAIRLSGRPLSQAATASHRQPTSAT